MRETCNFWRNYDDINDSWDSIKNAIKFYGADYGNFNAMAGPGAWNDPDMVSGCQAFIQKKVKGMQRPGTEAIRTQIQPSIPKREITKIKIVKIQREHMVNRMSSSFPKDGYPATQTELKMI